MESEHWVVQRLGSQEMGRKQLEREADTLKKASLGSQEKRRSRELCTVPDCCQVRQGRELICWASQVMTPDHGRWC